MVNKKERMHQEKKGVNNQSPHLHSSMAKMRVSMESSTTLLEGPYSKITICTSTYSCASFGCNVIGLSKSTFDGGPENHVRKCCLYGLFNVS